MLLALGAAGVTLAVVVGVIGLPAVNACSADPRGVITCLRDMADRKFDLPGSVPGQVAETAPANSPEPAPQVVIAETQTPAASGGAFEAPAADAVVAPLDVSVSATLSEPAAEPSGSPAHTETTLAAAKPAASAAGEMAAAPEPVSGAVGTEPGTVVPEVVAASSEPEPEAGKPSDTALTWSASPEPEQADPASEARPAAAPVADPQPPAPGTQPSPVALPPAAPQPEPEIEVGGEPAGEPAAPKSDTSNEPDPLSSPVISPPPPLVVANAEPASAQPPAPTIAAPVILAPTIDAIELDAGQSFVSGSGPAGALMRLFADDELIGESPVEEGRWLVEGSNLLDNQRSELRVEAIEPETGKLLGVAAITVEIELPEGSSPPEEPQEQTPDLGSGVAPAPQPQPIPVTPSPALPPATLPSELADNEPAAVTAVPADEPAEAPALVVAEPELAAVEPKVEPEPLPPLAAVVPRGESASVEILAPSTLEPTILPTIGQGSDDASTVVLPMPDAPALIAEFDIDPPPPAPPSGQPVTILRLLPFGDPDQGRYNVGKAIIRRGDTLWSIARRYYGHGIHYRTIFHANRELIRRPSRIFPGQIFDLPLVTDD
ncbi:MAG TPA: LysM peptidoglycan-binding domain-containing protein [Devosia sp.]|uniref:LysM peptidoglycan-binding domain-containing protein n=1 Tax=Devosia sp. TaxID=1871048 RepID=UPI002DDD2B2B|nr:LysM peptidoglycan-binding domain-containing protein [Devosia sp.]HEV2514124.1 LysM peptidoglycan-binding domain-containing protein [Devosia sp.]